MNETDSLAQRLSPLLEPLEADIREKHYRVVPSAFSSSDPYLRALPLARDWSWPTCEDHLKRFGPETVILQLPSFWQLEPFVHAAARAAGAPVCIIEPQNYPLDKAAVRYASANAVVAESPEAAAIAEHLHAGQTALPPYWMLIHAADAPQWGKADLLMGPGLEVAQEVHLAPGVPLLVQCGAIVAAKSGFFHHSALFAWNGDLSAPRVSTDSLVFALKDFALPFALADKGVCACGQRLLARVS